MSWLSRLYNAIRPNRTSREIDRELAFHIAEKADDLVAAGMTPADAEAEARRRFGNYGVQKERTRDRDILVWLDSLIADTRYAFRALRASPGFAVVAIASLALGIGANAAIFTLINAVMLRSLPVPSPEELVVIERDGGRPLTHAMWEEIRERQDVFDDAFAYTTTSRDLSTGGEARRVPAGLVSGTFFSTLGVRPAVGRAITNADDQTACPSIAVISHDFWQTEFDGAAAAVGNVVRLDGHPFQIVGVAPPSFFGIEIGYHIPVWVPLCAERVFYGPEESGNNSRAGRLVIGRMKSGVTKEAVLARLAALRPLILDATVQYSAPKQGILMNPAEYRRTTFAVEAFANGDPALRSTYGKSLVLLMAVVGVVLLIACANVANLLLARATARQREIAVRLAIGASRGRLVRQLLTESLLLAGLGAALGAVLAVWGSRVLVAFLSTPRQAIALDLTPDTNVVAFTIAVAVATGVLFGLAPAWRAGRVDPYVTMRPRGRGVVDGHSRFSIGKALVIGQIALSLVSVTCAGLLLGTWRRLATVHTGFASERLLLIGANANATNVVPSQRAGMYARIVERLRTVPGVTSAGAAAYTPLTDSWNTVINASATSRGTVIRMNEVSDGYFATTGTPILAGRDFGTRDSPTSPRVAVVSETLAREFLGGQAALGRSVRFGSPPNAAAEIIGIVGDTKQSSLRDQQEPMVYFPLSQDTTAEAEISFAIRTIGDPLDLSAAVTTALAEIDPRISFTITTLDRRLQNSIRLPRALGLLAGFFGALALLLAAIGLYGIMAYAVARRRNEIGIRVALGAARSRVMRLVLADVARMVVVGIVIGLGLSLATSRLVASMLYGIGPNDVPTLATAVIVLSAVALGAAAIPARRAAGLDPMAALRDD